MRVSVVIPSFDLAVELERTLAGLMVQQHVPESIEVIVVDLNSRVDSLESVHRRYRNLLPLYLIQLPELDHRYSLSLARNTGIRFARRLDLHQRDQPVHLRFARHEWIACLDTDCIPGPSYFDNLRKYLEQEHAPRPILSAERVFVDVQHLGAAEIVADAGQLDLAPRILSASNYNLVEDRRLTRLRQLNSAAVAAQPWDVIHSCNVVFRREDALAIGGYDESYDGWWGYEDIDFAYRMISQRGCEPVYAEGCHVFHQERDGHDLWHGVRGHKVDNPNWDRICRRIPGYREFKKSLYSGIAGVSM